MADMGELDLARSFTDGGTPGPRQPVPPAGQRLRRHPSAGRPYPARWTSWPCRLWWLDFAVLPQRHRAGHGRDGLRQVHHAGGPAGHASTTPETPTSSRWRTPSSIIYAPDRCIVNQREIGRGHPLSYADGLRAILREDPDVILIGEMRDLNTIETALTAAETGHLVFATLHTNSAADAVDRMVDVFPAAQQQQIRLQLSTDPAGGPVSQQLLPPRGPAAGASPACELHGGRPTPSATSSGRARPPRSRASSP